MFFAVGRRAVVAVIAWTKYDGDILHPGNDRHGVDPNLKIEQGAGRKEGDRAQPMCTIDYIAG